MKNNEVLINFWLDEEQRSFKGWDFSSLNKRWLMEDLPWEYNDIVREYLSDDLKILDMGTGDGKLLLEFDHPYKNTSVTEGYYLNFELCKETISELGIEVKYIENDENIPYSDDSFDVIINRHESFSISEVYRVLKNNGVFITQQVGNLNSRQMADRLGCKPFPINNDNDLANQIELFKSNSFDIIYSNEYMSYLKFFDIGALVYYAKIIEWEFQNFSVSKSIMKLQKLQEEIERNNFVISNEHRYILVATKISKF